MNEFKYFFEVYKNSSASNWLFQVDTEEYEGNPTIFWIVHREFFEKHKHFDDHHIGRFLKNILPPGFGEALESGFEYCSGSTEEGIQALLDAGLKQIGK